MVEHAVSSVGLVKKIEVRVGMPTRHLLRPEVVCVVQRPMTAEQLIIAVLCVHELGAHEGGVQDAVQ